MRHARAHARTAPARCLAAGPALVAIALLALATAPALAELASETEMRRVCENFLGYTVHQQGHWAGSAHPSITDVQELHVRGADGDGTLLARNYSISPRGHIMVPVLKELPPIKVYSEQYDIDVDQDEGFPAMLREILGDRARRFVKAYGSLDAVQPDAPTDATSADGPVLFGPSHRALWDRFLAEPQQFQAALARGEFAPREQVGPLLTTIWHQFEPYFDYCPMGDGGRCVVGCVATATAQTMRYWAWPPVGVGGSCHDWNGDQSCGGHTPGEELCADYSDPYDWENMPDGCYGGCTPEEEDALAELNYEVGVGELIDYGFCGSGGLMSMVNFVLAEYFRYDPGLTTEWRGNYLAEGWFALIQSEINPGRPMVYAYIGHALVCDGWRDTGPQNEIHMNYGWGGGYNAWYAIDELFGSQDPLQEMLIRGIMPDPDCVFTLRADGNGDLPTIQDAVDVVRDGNIIELEDGVYTGPGNRDIDLRGKVLTIRSVSGDFRNCIIDCQGSAAEPHRAFDLRSGETAATIIAGLTIRGGYAGALDPSGGAVFCLGGSSPTLRNCLLTQNTAAERGGAVYCGDSAAPELRNCIFLDNDALGEGGALACDGATPGIESCCFLENAAAHGSAIAAIGDCPLEIERTIIAFGLSGEPVACIAGGSAALSCCDVYGNDGGDWIGCLGDQLGVNGNISADPLFCDAAMLDFTLATESPCVPHAPPNEECELIGAFGVGCGAIVVYEDGAGPFPTIQSAIDAAIESSTVLLADGVFTGAGNRDVEFHGKALTVRSLSGDPDLCIIDCQGSTEEWHRGFDFASGEGPASLVEGVTVRNGYHEIAGGVRIESASPTFRNVVFADNYADFGGALRARDGSTPLFERAVFLRNAARIGGGAYCMDYANATFRNCTFQANSATNYGAGLRVHNHTNAILENTIISFSPSGVAISCNNASYPVLSCCDLYGNAGGDWTDQIADQLGVDGNISADPLFCDTAADDVRLTPESPCAPYAPPNEECGLLGARWVGCGVSGIAEGSDEGSEGTTEDESLVRHMWLRPAHPSPMTAVTRIEFGIPRDLDGSRVRLQVIDPSGRTIRSLADGAYATGRHVAVWDGLDRFGRATPGGVYFLRLTVGDQEEVRRVVLTH